LLSLRPAGAAHHPADTGGTREADGWGGRLQRTEAAVPGAWTARL